MTLPVVGVSQEQCLASRTAFRRCVAAVNRWGNRILLLTLEHKTQRCKKWETANVLLSVFPYERTYIHQAGK